jgi:hypothetical protein
MILALDGLAVRSESIVDTGPPDRNVHRRLQPGPGAARSTAI